jgi:hypothetical protein
VSFTPSPLSPQLNAHHPLRSSHCPCCCHRSPLPSLLPLPSPQLPTPLPFLLPATLVAVAIVISVASALFVTRHTPCYRRAIGYSWLEGVASRTLGQGFNTLRCRNASRIRSWGLGPHMSNQGTLGCKCRVSPLKTTRPSWDRMPEIWLHYPNWLATNSRQSPCQLLAEGVIWWQDSSNYGKG